MPMMSPFDTWIEDVEGEKIQAKKNRMNIKFYLRLCIGKEEKAKSVSDM